MRSRHLAKEDMCIHWHILFAVSPIREHSSGYLLGAAGAPVSDESVHWEIPAAFYEPDDDLDESRLSADVDFVL